MRPRLCAGLVLALISSTTACTGSQNPGASSSASATSNVGSEPSETASAGRGEPLGTTQTTAGGGWTLKASVLRMARPLKAALPGLPQNPKNVYIGIEAQVCVEENATSTPVKVGWSSWSLSGNENDVAKPVLDAGDQWWDVTLYPYEKAVSPGRCVKGWLPFEVKKGFKAVLVSYEPGGMSALEWETR